MGQVLNKGWFSFKEKVQIRQTIIITVLAILFPLFLGKIISLVFGSESLISENSKIIIGIIINSLLIVSALNLKGFRKLFGVIVFPSIASICSLLLYGGFNYELLYMLPAIWISNFVFIYIFKRLFAIKKRNYFLTGLIAIIAKILIVFIIFLILNSFGLFPSSIVSSLRYQFGIMQVFTGVFGVLLGYLILTSYVYE